MKSVSKFLAIEGNMRVFAVQTLISQLGFGMFFVIWQPYILSRGVTIVELGLVQSILNLSTAGGLIAWGVIADRYGRKPVILVSNVCRILSMVALIISGNIVFLVAFAFLMGVSSLFMVGNPARSAMITESVDAGDRATAFSTLMSISMITNTVMSSAGGYIAVSMGYTPILYASLIGDVLGTILLSLFLRETLTTRTDIEDSKSFTDKLKGFFMPEPGIGKLYLMFLIMGLGYGTSYSLLYGTLVDHYGVSDLQLGLMSTVFNLTWGLASIPIGKLSDRVKRRPMLLASLSMALVTVVGFILARNFEVFLLLQITSAMDVVFWIPAWMSLIAEKVPQSRRSTVMGKIDAYAKISGIPAPWIGGIIYETYGFKAPLYAQLVCVIVVFSMVFSLKE